jgi:hypothetical protein
MPRIYEGGSLMFNALAYGVPHPSITQFLSNSMENLSTAIHTAGESFVQNTMAAYERYSGHDAMRAMRAVSRAVRNFWQEESIHPLTAIDQLQHAPLTMQRWLMAEPLTRRAYHQQRCDGYSETYVDIHPGDIGHMHYDYRRVMQGFVQVDDADEEGHEGFTATTYFDELLPGDEELDLGQQCDIVQTWAYLRAEMDKGGDDPTSRFNSAL